MGLFFELDEFKSLLNTMSIPHSEERINWNIFHITIWRGSQKFLYIFHYDGERTDTYYLFNVLEVK